ncbi:MAG: tetratricopeptide repeat protein, partial [Hyphomicrobiaceae bacterium]
LTMKSASHGGGIFPKEMCPGEQTKEQNTGESIAAIYREAVPEAIVQIARLEQAKLFLSDAYELQANSLQPEALELITAAAALGHPQGNLHLGRAYLDGAGITQNTDLALRHLNTAISRGATTAATILGDIYHNGKIGDINIQRAIHFYEIAMDGGDPWAAIKLAKVLETLKEDPAEAWNSAYDLLVNTGFAKRNPYAAFTCYEILAFGKGKKVDPLMANSHLNDASELGHEVAKSIVEKVSER